MRRVGPLLIGLALASCISQRGGIEGEVIVGASEEGFDVFASLWGIDAGAGGDEVFHLGQIWLGVAPAGGARFSYSFPSLVVGRYVVGAYSDRDADGILGAADEVSMGLGLEVLEVDASGEVFRRDLYLAASASDRGALRGRVHRSAGLASRHLEVLALDRPFSSVDAILLDRRTLAPGSETTSFVFYNLPPGPVHLMVVDELDLSGSVGFDPHAPRLIAAGETVEGAELWLGKAAPGLGEVAGEVQLNGALSQVEVQLFLFSGDPTQTQAPLVGWTHLDASQRLSTPFRLHSAPLRSLWMAGVISTPDGAGGERSAVRFWSLSEEPTPIVLSPEAPRREELVFEMGLGRVSGTIGVTNGTRGLPLWVLAVRPRPEGVFIHDYEVIPLQGEGPLSYEIFGLEDDRYEMQLVPDVSGDGSPIDEIEAGYSFAGSPASIEIVGGGRVSSSFNVSFSSPP